jgi:hypothetical protein
MVSDSAQKQELRFLGNVITEDGTTENDVVVVATHYGNV